jgi:hypothetical protein
MRHWLSIWWQCQCMCVDVPKLYFRNRYCLPVGDKISWWMEALVGGEILSSFRRGTEWYLLISQDALPKAALKFWHKKKCDVFPALGIFVTVAQLSNNRSSIYLMQKSYLTHCVSAKNIIVYWWSIWLCSSTAGLRIVGIAARVIDPAKWPFDLKWPKFEKQWPTFFQIIANIWHNETFWSLSYLIFSNLFSPNSNKMHVSKIQIIDSSCYSKMITRNQIFLRKY